MIASMNHDAPNSAGTTPDPGPRSAGLTPAKAEPTPQELRTFTIGEMSRDFNVTFRTLRFYEARGLLQPQRLGANRIYRPVDRARLKTILKGKQLGFTLSEIAEMVDIPVSPASCDLGLNLELQQISAQIGHLEQQRLHIEEAISELRAVEQRLSAA